MRCNICDRVLSDAEVVWSKDLGAFEPCTTCLDIALDAAYSDGFKPEGEEDEQFGSGAVDILDLEENTSIFSLTDLGEGMGGFSPFDERYD